MHKTIAEESLLFDSSRMMVDLAVKVMEGHPDQLQAMIANCSKPYPISMRAARVLQVYFEKHPNAISAFLPMLSNELLISNVDGVKRSFLKILSLIPLITNLENAPLILDKCLEWLFSDKEAIAVRAYSIDLLIKFALEEPGLLNEIRLAFEILPTEEYPSLMVRCRRGLKIMAARKSLTI